MSGDATRGDATDDSGAKRGRERGPDVPDWDDEYLDRVADRLQFNFDLRKDHRIRGESFSFYGELRMESAKQFFHPALSYGRHESNEHLFVRRAGRVTVGDLEALVALGHDLAGEWVAGDEEHFSTDFTFVVLVPEIPADVREFVAGFSDRTLLKYGYHGHYEINLLVVAPRLEELVTSENADVADAFALWPREERRGLLSRLAGRLGR